jgi:hypothetical protein
MKGMLPPLRLNELLDRPLIVPFNSAFVFLSCIARCLNLLFLRSVSNARINRRAINVGDESGAFASPVE